MPRPGAPLPRERDEPCAAVALHGGFEGESYADIPTVARTVGLVPPETRAARTKELKEIADFAKLLSCNAVGLHIGFVPHDTKHPLYGDVIAIAREICDHCTANGQSLHLETGQESADALLQFINEGIKDLLVNGRIKQIVESYGVPYYAPTAS